MSSSKKYSKNEEYETVISDIGTNGEGIGHLEDGYTLFVQGAVPGDRVLAHIVKAQKSFAYARLVRIINPSGDRIVPDCPVADKCGGCQTAYLSYPAQLRFKERKVRELLIRVGGIDAEEAGRIMEPIVGYWEDTQSDAVPTHFRNKAQYPVGYDKDGNTSVGFYAVHSHRIVPCGDCLIGAGPDRYILAEILKYMEDYHITAYDEASGDGLVRHILIRSAFASGEVMVCLVVNGKGIPAGKELAKRLIACAESVSDSDRSWKLACLCTSSNTRKDNVIMGEDYDVIWGSGYITDKIGDVSFRISPLSFYQVNPVQTRKLYGKALEFAGLTGGETVWDLYCGIGTISLFLAQKAGKVYGVEIVPQAIDNARENAVLNGMDNVEFFVGKAEEVLPDFYNKNSSSKSGKITGEADNTGSNATHPDVIVVDPPRKGCDSVCLETMVRMNPEKIVYVSCDPATLARDIRYLRENGGYRLMKAAPVDMFPNSVHVETVVLLSKAN